MSLKTTYYELVKPELTDVADITAMNQNWDIIDKELNDRVKKTGDSLTGSLTFNNFNDYHAVHKYRDIHNVRYSANMGCGILGGQGIVTLEVRKGNAIDSPLLGRLEMGDLGVSYVDSEGKRTYLARSEVSTATVE
jgi:hypothetical protein